MYSFIVSPDLRLVPLKYFPSKSVTSFTCGLPKVRRRKVNLLNRLPCNKPLCGSSQLRHKPLCGSSQLRHKTRSCCISFVVNQPLLPKAGCFFISNKRRGFAVPRRHAILRTAGCSILLILSAHISQRCPSPLGRCPWIVARLILSRNFSQRFRCHASGSFAEAC